MRKLSIYNYNSAKHALLILIGFVFLQLSTSASAQNPFLISVTAPFPNVVLSAPGQSAFYQNAGVLVTPAGNIPISLRATLVSISAGDTIRVTRSGDNPSIRANTGTLEAEVLWEAFDRNTGLPISGDPAFLITDVDGRNGANIESVAAECRGLTSFTTNGVFMEGVNANNNGAAQTNIRVTETNGTILGEGTQGQNGGQQEGYIQYNWTDLDNWTVTYFATTSGRVFQHDGDADIPFDGTQIEVPLIDLATIKTLVSAGPTPPGPGETVTWTIDLSNESDADATGASVIDTLPTNVTFDPTTISSVTTGNAVFDQATGTLSWTGVDVAAGATETLTITGIINPGTGGQSVLNATETAILPDGQAKCSSRDLLEVSFIINDPQASLSIDKSVGTPTIAAGGVSSLTDAGDTITYTYVIENTGNVTLTNVVPVDPGPTFNNNNPVAGTNSLSAFTPATAVLAPGESQTFTAVYTLSQDDVDNVARGSVSSSGVINTATATGTPPVLPAPIILDPVAPSTAVTGFDINPDITLVKALANPGDFNAAGDLIEYTFTITNSGNITLTNVSPREIGPTVNGGGAAGFFPQPFSPNGGVTLAPGESQVFTRSYQISATDVNNVAGAADPLTSIDNQFTANGQGINSNNFPQGVLSNTVETGFIVLTELTITKAIVGGPDETSLVGPTAGLGGAGDTINYTWTVTNSGGVAISNIIVSDPGPTFNGQPATNNLTFINPSNVFLNPGQSQTFSASYTLAPADVDNILSAANPEESIVNISSVVGSPPGGGQQIDADSNSITTGFPVDVELTLEKSVTGPSIGAGNLANITDVGDTLSYSFLVTNDGDVTLNNVSIDDAGPTFNGQPGQGTFSVISCQNSTLASAQTTTCTATYTLAQSDIDNAIVGGPDSIDNSATAQAELGNGTAVVSNDSAAQASIVAESAIELTKTGGAPSVNQGADGTITDPGDTIDYTILVENAGNSTLSSVLVSDSLVTVTCPATTTNGNPFVNDGSASLAPGDSITCDAQYDILQADINVGEVVNTASVASQDPNGVPTNATDQERTGFTQRASVTLVKTASPQNVPDADTDLTYTFSLENTGNVSLTTPTVTDPLCTAPATVLDRNTGFVTGDTNNDNILDSDELWEFSCTRDITQAEFDAAAGGDITNTATGTGTPPAGLAPPESNASALVRAQENVGISLDKLAGIPTVDSATDTLPTLTDEGDTVSYTFTVTNSGNVTLTNVSVADPLIEGAGGSVVCPVTDLAPDESVICTAIYTLTQADIDAGQVSNTATATGTPDTAVPVAAPTAVSSAMVTIVPAPSLDVVKTVDPLPSPFVAGEIITYRYSITNTGNVTINDVLPVDAGPSFNNAAAVNSLSAFSTTAADDDLEPGETIEFSATYTLDQADIDNMAASATPITAIDNAATATGTPENGTLAAVTPSEVETGVEPTPELTLVKTSVPPTVTPPAVLTVGDTITYTFDVNNSGNVSISNPVVNDALCQPSTTLTVPDSGDDGNGILDVGETFVFSCSYAIQQSDLDAGTVQNTATATGQDPAGNDVSDVSGSADDNDDPTNTPLAQTAAWEIIKSTTNVPNSAGDTLVYTFTINNTGSVSIGNIVVGDPKCVSSPALVSGDIDNNSQISPAEIFTFSCTSIPVTQDEVDAGSVDNTVTVTGVPANGGTIDDSDTLLTPVAQLPSLSAVKSVVGAGATTALGLDAGATDAGDTISYQYNLTNTGNVTLVNPRVDDAGPSFNGTPGVNPLTVTCGNPVADLIPGGVVTCTATYTLAQADVDNAIVGGVNAVENTAVGLGNTNNAANTEVSSDPSTANTTIEDASELTLVKTAGAPSLDVGDPTVTDIGDSIAYTIVTTNTGNTTLSNVVISDPLLPVLSCNLGVDGAGAVFANDGTDSLAVNESVSCTGTLLITQEDLNSGNRNNVSTASAQNPAGDDVSGVDDINTPLTQSTSIVLAKQADISGFTGTDLLGNSIPVEGDNVEYNFSLLNTGNVSLTDPSVTDGNCNASPVLSVTAGVIDGDTNSNGVFDSAETWQFTCDHTVTAEEINAGGIVNTADATGITPPDSGLPNPTSTASSSAELGQEAGISLIKMAGIPSVDQGALSSDTDLGDTVEYTFEIENTGNVTLNDVTLTDPLFSDFATIVLSCAGGLTSLSSISAGDTLVCTAIYDLTQDDIDNGFVMNTASVTGTPPAIPNPPGGIAPEPPVGTSSAMVPITPAPRLDIEKSASAFPDPASVRVGDIITYSFVITNTGNVTIANVEPIDTGPTFNGVDGTNVLSNFSPNNDLDPETTTLAPGASITFTATYTLSQIDLDNLVQAPDQATGIDNIATVDGEPENGVLETPTPDSAETGFETAPEVELRKTSIAPNPALVGTNITYTFELENTGNVSLNNPSINDPQCVNPSPTLSFTSGFVSGDNGVLAGVLDPGEIWVLECTSPLTQADIDAGTVQNTAIATGTDPSGTPASDTSDSGNPGDGAGVDDPTNTPLIQTPSWTVEKSTVTLPTQAGDTLVYEFVVRNTGNVSIGNIDVADAKCPAPNGPVLISGDLDASNTITPNEVFTYRCTSIPVTQAEADAGLVPNNVIVTGVPATAQPLPLDPAVDAIVTPLEAAPSLAIAKSVGAISVIQGVDSAITDAGDTITYNFVISNDGNVTVNALAVQDDGPSFNGVPGANPLLINACNPLSIEPGQSSTCSAVYILSQTDINNAAAGGVNSVSNAATAAGTPVRGILPPTPEDGATATILAVSELSIEKTAGEPTVANGLSATVTDVGDTISYSIEIQNTGNTTVSEIDVQDSIAAVDCAPFTLGVDSLAPDETLSCTAVYTLEQTDFDTLGVTNVASVAGVDPAGTNTSAEDTVETPLTPVPLMSLVKAVAGDSVLNADATFDQVFDFELLNTGTAVLSSIEIVDDLSAQFGACFDSVIDAGTVLLNDIAPANDSSNIIAGVFPVLATGGPLAPNDSVTVTGFTARFNPNAAGCTFPDPAQNSATATAESAAGPINDVSDSGTDPLAAGPNDAGVPTPFTPPLATAELGISKAGQAVTFNDDFSFDAEFVLLMQNTGDVDLSNLSLFDDIATQYGAAFTPSSASDASNGVIVESVVTLVTDAPGTAVVLPTINPGYAGDAGNMFDGTSGVLGVGDVIQVVFSIRAEPGNLPILPEAFENTANGSASAPDGSLATDLSNSGSDPSVGAGGETSPTIITIDDIASLPIVMGMFSSERISPSEVLIEWQTQTEVANLGFNLYARVDGEWEIINPDVIPGNGDSVAVVSYSYSAQTSADAIALSDIDARGEEVLHGPFMVGQTYGQEAQSKNTDWSEAIQRRQSKEQLRDAKRKAQMQERNRLRQQRLNGVGE